MIHLTIREIISIQNLNVRYFVIWVAEQIQILVRCYCRYGVKLYPIKSNLGPMSVQ